jgi:hypothetical protein
MQNDKLPKQAFKYHPRGERDLEDLEADGNCKMLEQDLMDLIHEVRRRRRQLW